MNRPTLSLVLLNCLLISTVSDVSEKSSFDLEGYGELRCSTLTMAPIRRVVPTVLPPTAARARTLMEAVIFHGGKAGSAPELVHQFAHTDRAAFIAFLQSF